MSDRITDERLKELATREKWGTQASIEEWQAMAQELLGAREALKRIKIEASDPIVIDVYNYEMKLAGIVLEVDKALKGTP